MDWSVEANVRVFSAEWYGSFIVPQPLPAGGWDENLLVAFGSGLKYHGGSIVPQFDDLFPFQMEELSQT